MEEREKEGMGFKVRGIGLYNIVYGRMVEKQQHGGGGSHGKSSGRDLQHTDVRYCEYQGSTMDIILGRTEGGAQPSWRDQLVHSDTLLLVYQHRLISIL